MTDNGGGVGGGVGMRPRAMRLWNLEELIDEPYSPTKGGPNATAGARLRTNAEARPGSIHAVVLPSA